MTNSGEDRYAATNAAIRLVFEEARRILIVSHIRPDGDAVGSLMGLGLALTSAGKNVRMVLVDGVPQNLRHLEGSDKVHRSAGSLSDYDTLITVDCSDLQRVGGVLENRSPDLNIDHHITNLGFGKVNLVIPEQVATCAIVAEFLESWGLSYNKPIADALLTGIVTDTIGFRTSNVTPGALRLAAMLMEHGANLPDLYTRALILKTFEAGRYWGMGLSKLQREDDLVYTSLTLADRQAAQYPGNDDADLVNMLSALDCDVAVIFIEQKNGHVKVSWRARSGYDVSKIALQFGGGGHAAAAGADIPGELAIVQDQVLEATKKMLDRAYTTNNNGKKPVKPEIQ